MKTRTKLFGKRGLILVGALVVILLAGLNITRVAAQAAIPGDALYPIKTAIEKARLSLTDDVGERAEMKLAFAEQRLQEITTLIEEGRYTEIGATVLAFEANINSAIIELQALSELDPGRASEIALEITSALTRYAQSLSIMGANAPENVQQELNRALDTTQILGGLGSQINDDNANGNVNGDDDNGNANDNDNGNTNDDDNGNANGDDNGNANDDDNGNANDDGIGNANDNGNGNDNGNANDDDNANANANGNVNASTNGNDNGNDNGDDNGNDD